MQLKKNTLCFTSLRKSLANAFWVIIFVVSQALGEDVSQSADSNISLLKFPYPYRAALTVASDTHTTPIETFEAVHKLINSNERIHRDSDTWRRLFDDPHIDENEVWREGIDGFGLPIADSFWLYARGIGVFAAFDGKTGQPVPQAHNGRDLQDIIDGWLRLGWVDTLHTPGYGNISRQATAAGLKWLKDRHHGHLKVWSNHSHFNTPTCVGPDRPDFKYVIKNYIRCATIPLRWLGMESLARKISRTPWGNPYPRPFPRGQGAIFWLLGILLAGSLLWLLLCLIINPFRKAMHFTIGGLIFASLIITLNFIPVRYEQGDNPDSPYYHADLTRQFGFRYYWFIRPLPGYQTHVPGTLVLPETSNGGRPSCLRIVRLDDGSQCITFGRNYKRSVNAYGSLELLTKEALENLCDHQGTSVIYTHWTGTDPKKVFTAEALEGLTRLRRFYKAGRIWVAPTSEIIHFTFIRAYIEYGIRLENGTYIIEIRRITNPVGESFVPNIEDLRGISFNYPASESIEVRLAGEPVENNILEYFSDGDRMVISFPLERRL